MIVFRWRASPATSGPGAWINSPIQVCQQNISRTGTIIKWALKPFRGLHDVPMEFSKIKDQTIVKIETQQGRIVDGVKGMAGFAQKTFNLSDPPVKVETEDTKTIVTMELTNWIFCDCDLQQTEALPKEGDGEEERDYGEEEDELLVRLLPGYGRTTTGKFMDELFEFSTFQYCRR